MTNKIKFLDLFGGIGGFRLGLEKASDRFECIDYIEIDKYAVKSYNAIFQEEHEPKDATKIQPENLPDFELLCAGFPCQAFSIAGNRKGFEDTRGTLFFEIARITREKLPKILLLENVKGLLNHADGETFKQILSTLDELGYNAQWQVLNSKYHGVPQNRERVFIVASRGGEPIPEVFPFREPDQRTSGESEKRRIECINPRSNHHYRIYEKYGLSPTLMSSTGGGSAKHPYVLSEGLGVRNQRGELQQSSYSTAIDANYHKGIDNHGARTGIIDLDLLKGFDFKPTGEMETIVPNRPEIGQADRVYELPGVAPALNKGWNPQILDWHGHKDKPPKFREDVPTLRANSHGRQPKLLQKSHDWRENNELREFTEYSPTIRKDMGDNLPLWLQNASDERVKVRIHRDDEKKSEIQGYSFFLPNCNYVDVVDNHDKNILEPVITPDFKDKDMNKKSPIGSQDGNMFTVDGTSIHGVTDGVRIRKLTPRECWRLQGFPDWAFEKAQKENSDTQLYKQAGNSVTVNVIEDVGERILEVMS